MTVECEGEEGEDAGGDGEVGGEVVHLAIQTTKHPYSKQYNTLQYRPPNIHTLKVLYSTVPYSII